MFLLVLTIEKPNWSDFELDRSLVVVVVVVVRPEVIAQTKSFS